MSTWIESGLPLSSVQPGVLLLGNGVNRATAGQSWTDVVEAVASVAYPYGLPPSFDREKPFPLLYEEVFLEGSRLHGVEEETLLGRVAADCDLLASGPLHARVAALPVQSLLTTNYDCITVESFLGAPGLENAAAVRETRYSLFRRVTKGRTVWQMHGSQALPSSIMLGYEHYSGYLEQMRRYVTRSVMYQGNALEGLMKRRATGGLDGILSWVDYFFLADVAILGLSLDFVEMHLWWLLTYRARQRTGGRSKAPGNRICYFAAPEHLEDNSKHLQRRRRFELLRAADVEVEEGPVNSATWYEYYETTLQRVESWLT